MITTRVMPFSLTNCIQQDPITRHRITCEDGPTNDPDEWLIATPWIGHEAKCLA